MNEHRKRALEMMAATPEGIGPWELSRDLGLKREQASHILRALTKGGWCKAGKRRANGFGDAPCIYYTIRSVKTKPKPKPKPKPKEPATTTVQTTVDGIIVLASQNKIMHELLISVHAQIGEVLSAMEKENSNV